MADKLDFYDLASVNRNVYINDEIFHELSNSVVKHIKDIIDNDKKYTDINNHALKKVYPNIDFDLSNKKNLPVVNVYVDSPGGSVYSMFSIYDQLKKLQDHCQVNMYGTGLIASAAIPIFLSADEKYRKCTRNTSFLIHQVSSIACGTVHDFEDQTSELKRVNTAIFDIIMARTKISQEQLDEVYEKKKDWIITAEEALKMGIVSEII